MRLTNPDRDVGQVPGEPLAGRWGLPLIGVLLALVFWLDRATDAAPVQHLYYAPIILAAVAYRLRGGLSTAAMAVILYHLANPGLWSLSYEEGDVVQIALFVAVGLVTAKLTGDARRMRALAMTDDLTGLHNLRSFEGRLRRMIRAMTPAGEPLSLLVLDVDRLKSINDAHGHLTGAEAVRAIGRIIAATVPADGVACRYGGDEFVVALPRCSEADALGVAGRIRDAVNAAAPVLAGRSFPPGSLSISIGVACRLPDGRPGGAYGPGDADTDGEALFRAADRALYFAKNDGRNQVALRGVPGARRHGPPVAAGVCERDAAVRAPADGGDAPRRSLRRPTGQGPVSSP